MDLSNGLVLQSATEFLATYSWAFLVLTVMIAAVYLVVLAPSGGSTYVPSSCYITSTLPCYQSVLLANSTGSEFIVLLQNDMGVTLAFPPNSISLHPSFSSNAVYVGSCLPLTAAPGAVVTCNVTLSGASFKPAVGSQANPTFTLSYQICPACGANSPQLYNTTGTSTLTVSSYSSVLYTVHLLSNTGTGNIVVSGVRYPSGANVVFISGVNYPIYAIAPNSVSQFATWLASNLLVSNPLQRSTTAQGAVNPDPAACLQVAFNSIFYTLTVAESPNTLPATATTPLGGTYPEVAGTVMGITAVAPAGYTFNGWTAPKPEGTTRAIRSPRA